MSLLPDAPGMELLHSRDYEIKVYRTSEAELLRIGNSKALFGSDKRHYVK